MTPSPSAIELFLDGDLSPDEQRRALHRIADDPDSVAQLRFDARLRRALRESASESVPVGFSDRVMAAVDARGPRRSEERPPRPAQSPRRARTLRLAAVAACVAAAAFGVGRFSAPPAAAPPAIAESDAPLSAGIVSTRFVFLEEHAATVAVAGDFTQWDPVPLRREELDGRVVWSGVLAVPQGEHRYMFVVDGDEWVTDPLADVVRDDGFGNRNAILTL